MKWFRFLIAAPMLLAAAPATGPIDPALAKRLAAYRPLPPQTCISDQMLEGPSTYAGAVLYRGGRKVYVNRFHGACHLEEDDALTVVRYGGQLCEGDRATPIVPSVHVIRPTCIFGPFEPYERPAGRP